MSDYSYIPPIVKEFTFALDIADVVKVVSDFCRQKYWTATESSGIRYAARSKSVVYRLRSGGVTPASDCQIEVVGRPISKTTRITAQSLECSQDFADHYPASLHRYHACVDSLLAHLADFEITPNLGPTLAQPEPEPVTPADDVSLAEPLPTDPNDKRLKTVDNPQDRQLIAYWNSGLKNSDILERMPKYTQIRSVTQRIYELRKKYPEILRKD